MWMIATTEMGRKAASDASTGSQVEKQWAKTRSFQKEIHKKSSGLYAIFNSADTEYYTVKQ